MLLGKKVLILPHYVIAQYLHHSLRNRRGRKGRAVVLFVTNSRSQGEMT